MRKKWPIISKLVLFSLILFVLYVTVFSTSTNAQIKNEVKESSPNGIDYMMLYTAGRTALIGNAAGIYDVTAQQNVVEEMLGTEMPKDVKWFYPPTFLLLLVTVFSIIPFYSSLILWLISTLLIAVLSLYILLPKDKNLSLVVLGFPAVLYNFRWGQNSFLSTALFALGISFYKTNPVFSGLMFGLMTYKPQLAFFPFLVLLVTKEWKVLKWSLLFALLTVIVSIILFGPNSWISFINHSLNETPDILSSIWVKTAVIQPTLYTALRIIGLKGTTLILSILFVGIMVTILTALIWRKTERITLRGSAMILGIFAFSPYFIQYDLMLLSIPFVLLIYDLMEYGYKKIEIFLVGLLWIMPILNMIILTKTNIQVIPFISLIILILIYSRTSRIYKTCELKESYKLR